MSNYKSFVNNNPDDNELVGYRVNHEAFEGYREASEAIGETSEEKFSFAYNTFLDNFMKLKQVSSFADSSIPDIFFGISPIMDREQTYQYINDAANRTLEETGNNQLAMIALKDDSLPEGNRVLCICGNNDKGQYNATLIVMALNFVAAMNMLRSDNMGDLALILEHLSNPKGNSNEQR